MREDLAGHTPMSSCGGGCWEEVMSHSCRTGHSAALSDSMRSRDQILPLQVHSLFPHFLHPLKPPPCLETVEVAAQEVSKCITKQTKPSMARTRELKTGCETLEAPDATPETVDSQTTGTKFDHSLLFRLERPLSSLSSTTNLPLRSPPHPHKPLHRLKMHQSCKEGQQQLFSPAMLLYPLHPWAMGRGGNRNSQY